MEGCLEVLLGHGCMEFGMAWLVGLLEADLIPSSQHESLCRKARPARDVESWLGWCQWDRAALGEDHKLLHTVRAVFRNADMHQRLV